MLDHQKTEISAKNTDGVLVMPETVALLPNAKMCWHIITDDQTRFSVYEQPLLEAYCLAYAASRQAIDNMTESGDGTLEVIVQMPSGAMKKNPNWQVWNEAVDKMRHLSGVLALDTLTSERLNLTRAATSSLAADIPSKVAKAVREMKAANGG